MTEPLSPAQRRLVEGAVPIIVRIATKMHATLGVEPEDLESVGNEALVRAAQRYDPETGVPFMGFAYYRVRGAMIDSIRRRDRAGRQKRRAEVALEASQALLEEASERPADQRATLAERVKAAKRLVDRTTSAVLVTRTALDVEEHPGVDFEAQLQDRETRTRVRDAIAALPAEEAKLIDALYREGVPMRVFAERIGTSPATICRRHARVIDKLSRRLADTGPPR